MTENIENLIKTLNFIFNGNQYAHGKFYIGQKDQKGKYQGVAKTEKQPLTNADWKRHILGEQYGIGVIPVDHNGMCSFGVIDIDNYQISKENIIKNIKDHNLPLIPFKSKSNGLHLYLFSKQKVSANKVRKILSHYLTILGLPKDTEIFPKQDILKESEVGNWINLPFYDFYDGYRAPLMSDCSKMAFEQFKNEYKRLAIDTKVLETIYANMSYSNGIDTKSFAIKHQKTLTKFKLPEITAEGERNNTLVSYAGSLRAKGLDENEIRSELETTNDDLCNPPLNQKEIDNIIDWISTKSIVTTNSTHSLTDLGNSQAFIEQHKETALYSHERKCWYIWDGKRFNTDKTGKIYILAKQTVELITQEMNEYLNDDSVDEKIKNGIRGALKKLQSKSSIEAMIKLSQSELPLELDQMDRNPLLLNLENGVYDLEHNFLINHTSSLHLTKLAPVKYDKTAKCPIFMQFLNNIFDKDTQMIEYVQRIIGYSLTGSTEEHCFFILNGDGRNGKSTLLNIIAHLLGDYNKATSSNTFLMMKHESIRNDLAALKGARFVTATEVGQTKMLNEQLVKQITGGDILSVRFLYGEYFEYLPQFKVFIATNYLPDIQGIDNGIWSRIRIIPFNVKIPQEKIDPQLLTKLKAELSGILNWALDGYEAWKKQGLNEPKVIKSSIEQYKNDSNQTLRYIDACLTKSQHTYEAAGLIYNDYKQWCEYSGEAPYSQKVFGTQLTKLGYARGREHVKGRYVTVYYGIKLAEGNNYEQMNF